MNKRMGGKLWLVLLVAISTGCCGVWLEGCYGQEIDNDELKQILNGGRPDVLSEPDAKKVADLIAQAKDKEESFLIGVNLGRLLAVSMEIDEAANKKQSRDFCEPEYFKFIDGMCEKVSQNSYLNDYCTKRIDRLRDICIGSDDLLYKKVVLFKLEEKKGWMQELERMAQRIIRYGEETCQTSLTPWEIAVDLGRGIEGGEERIQACEFYIKLLEDLFVIDKGGKRTYKGLMLQKNIEYANMGIFCNVLLGKAPKDDSSRGEPWGWDYYGNKFEDTIELEKLKQLLDDKRPDAPENMDEKEVAGLLSKAKDKNSALFNGVSVVKLLKSIVHSERQYQNCYNHAKRMIDEVCKEVSQNKYMYSYCVQGIERNEEYCRNREFF